MNLHSIGISHHTAALDVREKMWLSDDEIRSTLPRLKQEQHLAECVLVSTCNRTELYGIATEGEVDDGALRRFLIEAKGAGASVGADHFVSARAGGAITHLFRVASGVESMVIGDVQILGQIKDGFNLARESGTMGPVMNRLMQAALHVGKRVRTETSIAEGAVSVSYAAVELASKIYADLSKKSVLLVGAGETGELTLRHLVGKGIGQIRIANRTREKAEALVASLGGTVIDYDGIVDALRTVDIVVTSVTSPSYIVQPEEVHRVMRQRSNNPLFIIDIGLPRNVNPAAGKIENVFLYDIDALSTIVDRNIDRRRSEIPHVTRIIREELVQFLRWQNSLEVGPTIQEFRESLEAIRAQEVSRNVNRFRPEDRELLEIVTRRIVNKILHNPTTVLKQSTESGGHAEELVNRVRALRDLFGIGGNGRDRHEE
ncbi:MAG TPA: glutamyl-tRNA reductase [Bacteroidota bacterium]|nr:glutamyl-tRNA reductase [Bacteroidota bacterium]